jgi:hypothetical protein
VHSKQKVSGFVPHVVYALVSFPSEERVSLLVAEPELHEDLFKFPQLYRGQAAFVVKKSL